MSHALKLWWFLSIATGKRICKWRKVIKNNNNTEDATSKSSLMWFVRGPAYIVGNQKHKQHISQLTLTWFFFPTLNQPQLWHRKTFIAYQWRKSNDKCKNKTVPNNDLCLGCTHSNTNEFVWMHSDTFVWTHNSRNAMCLQLHCGP